jgi:hypothetical protein
MDRAWRSAGTLSLVTNYALSVKQQRALVFSPGKYRDLIGWLCPSPSTHAKVGRRPPICHPALSRLAVEPERSGAEGSAVSLSGTANLPWAGCPIQALFLGLSGIHSIRISCREYPPW